MGESRITPSGIINDAVSMIGKMNDSSFPIDVFPNKIRNIILNMYEYLAFPIDYTACSMMTAISTCIGNTHILHFKTGWDIKCIIYMALVGRPGANKSHPLKTAFEPLFRFDKEQKEIYNEEYRKYESIMSLSKRNVWNRDLICFPRNLCAPDFWFLISHRKLWQSLYQRIRAAFVFTWMNCKDGSIISHAITKVRKNSSTYHCSMGTCIFPTAK